MIITQKKFDRMEGSRNIRLFHVKNNQGMEIVVSNVGASLVSALFCDRRGIFRDVVLGFDKPEAYLENGPHFGSVIGRNANRISYSSFLLDGEICSLVPNDGKNNLHSGPLYYDSMIWDHIITEDGVTFYRKSPEYEQGFPGNLDIAVTYSLTEDNSILITYDGICDSKTVINMTNHSYFNLAGGKNEDVTSHLLQINARQYTPFDRYGIPTGQIAPVKGTPLDFTGPKYIGEGMQDDEFLNGYDHNFVLAKKKRSYDWMARVWCEKTGIMMEAFTDCPAMQLYTGNNLEGIEGKNGIRYEKWSGLCLESQFCPDAVNRPEFDQPVVRAGHRYVSRTSYRFSLYEPEEGYDKYL